MNKAELQLLAEKELPHAINLRREIHSEPELGLHNPKTSSKAKVHLKGLPLEIREGKSTSGFLAILRGNTPGKTVLLRGDTDGLPITEQTGLSFAAKTNMHACGHDFHTSMLAAAARILCTIKDKISGTIIFMFQPGEEGYHGAKFMLEEEGLFPDGIDSAFAIHLMSNVAPGIFGSRPGPINSSGDSFDITIRGVGGHGAMPWNSVDPIPVGAQIVLALQSMITRRHSPVQTPIVLTVTKFVAGTAYNVVPKEANLAGTVRTFSEESRNKVLTEMQSLCEQIALAHQCTAELRIKKGYPATVNNAQVTELARQTVIKLFGSESYLENFPRRTGSEDFSYVLQRYPGCLMFLGASAVSEPAKAPSVHSETVNFDEGAMLKGIMMHCGIAMEMLSSQFTAKL